MKIKELTYKAPEGDIVSLDITGYSLISGQLTDPKGHREKFSTPRITFKTTKEPEVIEINQRARWIMVEIFEISKVPAKILVYRPYSIIAISAAIIVTRQPKKYPVHTNWFQRAMIFGVT